LARDLGDARSSIGRYLEFYYYNTKRPHSSLDRRTPNEACFHPTPQLEPHLAAAEIFRRALDVTSVGLRPPGVTPTRQTPQREKPGRTLLIIRGNLFRQV